MTRHKSLQRILVWWMVIPLVLAVWIIGCAGTYDSGSRAATITDPAARATTDDPSTSSASVERGKKLFTSLGCMGCHTVHGQGGTVGPDLSNESNKGRSRAWLDKQIRNPRANDPQTVMPAYEYLSDAKVNDLINYLLTLSTSDSADDVAPTSAEPIAQDASGPSPEVITRGGELWAQRCGQCHNLRPPSQYSDAQWTVAVHHMRLRVPLTGQEQREILAFLKASN